MDRDPAANGDPGGALTARQIEVLKLLVEGLMDKEIARRLGICTGAVRIHIEAIFKQLGVRRRIQAAILAVRAGVA